MLLLLRRTTSSSPHVIACHSHDDNVTFQTPLIASTTSSSAATTVADVPAIQRTRKVKIVVAMSGGVDSSVAAHLLMEQCHLRRRCRRSSSSEQKLQQVTTNNSSSSNDPYNKSSDGRIEVVGLHMSNWNALDEEDPEESNDAANDNNINQQQQQRRRQRGHRNDSHDYTTTTNDNDARGGGEASNKYTNTNNNFYCEMSQREYNDAQSVAQHLDNMKLHRVSFVNDYWVNVFEPFVRSLTTDTTAGGIATADTAAKEEEEEEDKEMKENEKNVDYISKQQSMTTTTTITPTTMNTNANNNNNTHIITTPNPDFGCNVHIKFGTMKHYAVTKLNANYIATGHYAQLWHRNHYFGPSSSGMDVMDVSNDDDDEDDDEDDLSSFYNWLNEMNNNVGQLVLESIKDLPEEEWILSSSTIANTANNSNVSNSNYNNHDDNYYPMLIAGTDINKDQSYFLCGVPSVALRNIIFPLGHLIKKKTMNNNNTTVTTQLTTQPSVMTNDDDPSSSLLLLSVREIAQMANLPTCTKPDSMGICFIGRRNFNNFVSQYLPPPTRTTTSFGNCDDTNSNSTSNINFIDIDTGLIVGSSSSSTHQHRGNYYYTIGQGAKVSGVTTKYYVCGREYNNVYVCNSTHHPALYSDELYIDYHSLNWIGCFSGSDDIDGGESGGSMPPSPLWKEGGRITVLARTRHLQPLVSCTVTWDRDNKIKHDCVSSNNGGSGGGRFVIKFSKPIRAITPGQICALYAGRDGVICLGGGPITNRGATYMERGLDVMSLHDLHPSGHNDLSLSHFH
jgi:tRNA U34 2-thiouridine synthase MnmA/TrmU